MFKVESGLPDSTSWWVVFAPLFVSDALNTYFCAIVLIRMYIEVSFIRGPTNMTICIYQIKYTSVQGATIWPKKL